MISCKPCARLTRICFTWYLLNLVAPVTWCYGNCLFGPIASKLIFGGSGQEQPPIARLAEQTFALTPCMTRLKALTRIVVY